MSETLRSKKTDAQKIKFARRLCNIGVVLLFPGTILTLLSNLEVMNPISGAGLLILQILTIAGGAILIPAILYLGYKFTT